MSRKNWGKSDIPDLNGKIALVTGGYGGLGYETSLALAGAGALVIVSGRNEEKAQDAIAKIRAIYPQAKLHIGMVDQSSLESVAKFGREISEKYDRLDILIHNAAAPMENDKTKEGFEIQLGVNHLSHFALTAHLLPLLRKSPGKPRVVTVSSLAHRRGSINFEDLNSEKRDIGNTAKYGQSKLANLLFMLELQRRSDAGGWGIMSNGAHPGYSDTERTNKTPGIVGWIGNNIIKPIASHSPAEGALPTLFAATSPEAEGGGYYGPNGYFETKGSVGSAYISPAAKDEDVAGKLWDVSVKLTHVTWP